MFTAKDYAMPQSLDEAYEVLTARKTNHIVAGCAWLRMGNKRINTAVDLSEAGLDYIRETQDAIEIGAMTSYRSVETSRHLQENFSGILSRAVAPIIGVQFRNVVTVGGSDYSRFVFSDFLTPLLALDTKVKLYREGMMSLEEFMQMPYKKDILEKIVIRKGTITASYQMFRNAEADFPLVNVAAVKENGCYKVTVGARPGRAVCAPKTAQCLTQLLSEGKPADEAAEQAKALLKSEISFGTNMRASAGYRQKIAGVLLGRAVKEVEGC